MAKTILLTGGGTAGHVTPNIALIPRLQSEGFTVHYIGTENGIERKLIDACGGVCYHTVSSGKLRRYFSMKNLLDPFRVLRGIFQARRIIRRVKPDVVFSKGGFVSVPVVVAAHKKAPIVTHESDYSPGLANKINTRFATRVCVTFEDTLQYTGSKGIHTGTPIRASLYEGDAQRGARITGFSLEKQVLLVMGGSQGAAAINELIRASLKALLTSFDIIHICGEEKIDEAIREKGYVQFEYLNDEFAHILSITDIVVSRAGANAVFEFLSLAKPALLIPLPKSASRGDQLLNASYFARKGYSMVMEQEKLTPDTLVTAVNDLYKNRTQYISKMKADTHLNGTEEVLCVIRSVIKE